MLKKLWNWIEKNEGLILILLLVVVLRIPSLYEPNWYGDEGIYLALGQGLRKGLVFYRDIHDNKPPMLYLLAAIAGNVFYFRLMLMIWFGAATVMFFRLMQHLMPKSEKAWYVSSLSMILLTTLNEGNIANAEIFIVLPVVWGMLLTLLSVKSKSFKKWLGIGLLFSVGFLLKVPAGFDMAAIVIWLVLFEKGKKLKEIIKSLGDKKSWLRDKRLWWLVLGFLLPIGLSLIYYAIVGGFEPYLRSALLQNIGYLSSWGTGEHTGGLGASGLMIRAGIMGLLILGLLPATKKFRFSKGESLVMVWFLFSLFGALLSERPYPHYLIQPIVPGAILLGFLLFSKNKKLKMVVGGLGLITLLAVLKIRFWHYPIVPYYRNFIEYSIGKKSKEEYRAYFDSRVNQTYKLAEYLQTTTQPDDRVFIWGNEPYVYAIAKRMPIGRYTVSYHIKDFNGYEETINAWDKYLPPVVIVMEYEEGEFETMYSRLGTDYVMVGKIDQGLIYRRVNGIKAD